MVYCYDILLIEPGYTGASYGIQHAEMIGIKSDIINRSKTLVHSMVNQIPITQNNKLSQNDTHTDTLTQFVHLMKSIQSNTSMDEIRRLIQRI